MNYLDIGILIILAIGLVRGFFKGFIVEVTSLAGLVLGIYGAMHFSFYLSDLLKQYVSWEASMLQLVSFAGTFFIILIVIALLGKFFTRIAESIALGILNKFLGAVFGLLKAALILSVIFLIANRLNTALPNFGKEKSVDSVLYEPVMNLAPAIFPNLVKEVDKRRKNNH